MFIQTRKIVVFRSERGKTLRQTREADEKQEKEEKNEAIRVWKKKNALPDPKYCGFGVLERKNVVPDPKNCGLRV